MDVNYKRTRYYNTAKPPLRPSLFVTALVRALSGCLLLGKQHTVEKVNMEGLKPPYILLSNHMSFVDFALVSHAAWPHRVNSVANIEGYYRRPWLMRLMGCICTRKFVNDVNLVRSIRKVLQRGDILCLYPEARLTPSGTTCFLPQSLGKLVKLNKVPVVVAIHRGNYLHRPIWNYSKRCKVPLHTTMTQLLSAQQVEELSVDEINTALRQALQYDDYRYWQQSGIRITEPWRAEGLHQVLYQCPHCLAESRMACSGSEIYCTACGKRWLLREDGRLQAQDGDTEFDHVPDWYDWQRRQVRRQIEAGEYFFEDEVDVYSLPGCYRYVPLGKARLRHDPQEGYVLEGSYNGQAYRIQRRPGTINSVHVEYDFEHGRPGECIAISTPNDSFYCFMTQPNMVTKLNLATEELYLRHTAAKKTAAKAEKQPARSDVQGGT